MSLKYCGFCHTDVHLANNDWKLPGFEYPAVVGHEIAGIVTKAGENVKAIVLILRIFTSIIFKSTVMRKVAKEFNTFGWLFSSLIVKSKLSIHTSYLPHYLRPCDKNKKIQSKFVFLDLNIGIWTF